MYFDIFHRGRKRSGARNPFLGDAAATFINTRYRVPFLKHRRGSPFVVRPPPKNLFVPVKPRHGGSAKMPFFACLLGGSVPFYLRRGSKISSPLFFPQSQLIFQTKPRKTRESTARIRENEEEKRAQMEKGRKGNFILRRTTIPFRYVPTFYVNWNGFSLI